MLALVAVVKQHSTSIVISQRTQIQIAASKLAHQSIRVSQQYSTGYLSFGPMAQCVVHALKGLACRAHVTPPTSPAFHARGCASPSHAQ
jgi:hypothetical protein